MDAVTSSDAAVGAAETWDDALARLLAYLEDFGIGGVEHRTRIALAILDEARIRYREGSAVACVMELAFTRMESWFGEAMPRTDDHAARPIESGWVAAHLAEAADRWPDGLLQSPPPQALVQALREATFRMAPDLEVSSMTSREMDFGAMETIAQETWHQFAWASLLRAVAIWVVIFFVALFAYDRFFPQ